MRLLSTLTARSLASIRPRNLAIDVGIKHDAPAYIDEAFDIHVDVVNQDEVDVEVWLDILLQPGEDDSRTLSSSSSRRSLLFDVLSFTANQLTIDGQATPSFVKAVSLGTLAPSASLRKTFQLTCVGSPGDRQLDLSIRAQPVSSQSASETSTTSSPSTEVLRTLTLSAVRPLHCAFDTHFHERRRAVKALLDLSEPNGWEGASDVSVVVKIHAAGPWDIEVSGMRVACEVSASHLQAGLDGTKAASTTQDGRGLRVTQSSLTGLESNLALRESFVPFELTELMPNRSSLAQIGAHEISSTPSFASTSRPSPLPRMVQ